ncbi:hypothetical protein Salmuc_04567 [Salipiger mucosus DSM 16094]|uniref:Uncharacterized protein n=2 Tax=Salipiger mucosus TaxID=263378 RepID=S9RNV4_9RHOB|nr:hypothetical protein Salmuc_04567 [Salipiger mucosus DSM 16094]
MMRFSVVPENAHLWGRLVVEELYPEHFSWTQPETDSPVFHRTTNEVGPGYRLNHRGMLECPKCETFQAVQIRWPQAAFWQWTVEGHTLIARNRTHAEEILAYLRETPRPPHRKPGLRELPAPLLKKRASSIACRRMERTLEAA